MNVVQRVFPFETSKATTAAFWTFDCHRPTPRNNFPSAWKASLIKTEKEHLIIITWMQLSLSCQILLAIIVKSNSFFSVFKNINIESEIYDIKPKFFILLIWAKDLNLEIENSFTYLKYNSVLAKKTIWKTVAWVMNLSSTATLT